MELNLALGDFSLRIRHFKSQSYGISAPRKSFQKLQLASESHIFYEMGSRLSQFLVGPLKMVNGLHVWLRRWVITPPHFLSSTLCVNSMSCLVPFRSKFEKIKNPGRELTVAVQITCLSSTTCRMRYRANLFSHLSQKNAFLNWPVHRANLSYYRTTSILVVLSPRHSYEPIPLCMTICYVIKINFFHAKELCSMPP